MKALVAYGTKYGSTSKVAKEIAFVLGTKGFETTVLDLKKGDGHGIDGFDLVVIGSSIVMSSWSKEALEFLEHNKATLLNKRVAMFVCSGNIYTNPEKTDEYRRLYLEDVATRFGIESPYAKGLFGGEIDFSKYRFLTKALVNSVWKDTKKGLQEKGVDFSKPFDFRDWDAIRNWAGSLACGVD
jgi:menaquinone-dependent protoporphyrinogen oxidase